MRQRVGKNCDPVARYIDAAEQHVYQGGGQKYETRYRVKKMDHCVEVAQPLWPFESAHEKRIIGPQHLNHPACPANPLTHMAGQTLCSKACRLRDIDVSGIPFAHLHTQ